MRTITNAVGLPRTARPPKCANGMNEAVCVLDGMRRLPSFRVGMVYGAYDRTRTAYPEIIVPIIPKCRIIVPIIPKCRIIVPLIPKCRIIAPLIPKCRITATLIPKCRIIVPLTLNAE